MKKLFVFFCLVVLLCGATLTAAQNVDDLVGVGGTPVAQGEMREPGTPAQSGAMEEPERATPSPRQTPPPAPQWETREGVEEATKAYFLTLSAPQRERVERITREIRYIQTRGASKAQVEKLSAELAKLRKELGGRFSYMESMLRNKLDAIELRTISKIEAEAKATRKFVKDEANEINRRLDNQGSMTVLAVVLVVATLAVAAAIAWGLTRANNQG